MGRAMINTASIHGVRSETLSSGSQILHFDHPAFAATLSLEGGQLIHYQHKSASPLLYLSPMAALQPGSSIRGGVPICWPWFGRHPDGQPLPQHGVARTFRWSLQQLEETAKGFFLQLRGPDYQGLAVDVSYKLEQQLEISLCTSNNSQIGQSVSCALHSYFSIANANHAEVCGLQNTRYTDKLSEQTLLYTKDSLPCRGEIDRIVYGVNALTIKDALQKRQILVETHGSNSMVLWNPGPSRSQHITDLPDNGWQDFFCVEAANAEQDQRLLAPGEKHTLTTRLAMIQL